MSYGSIYKIVFPNGKHYIGLTTTSLDQRTKQHKSCAKNGDTKCLYNALRKYDMVDTLELIEIDTADTLEELCEKEIGYIIEYNSYYMNKNGYNMTYGGEGVTGYVYTEEDKQKISEMCKKYWENPEAIQKCSESQKKRFENPEEIKKLSKIKKKYFEENPDAKQQNSERLKKYYEENPDAGKEQGERMKIYYGNNPEARQKMSEIKKKYHEEHPEKGEAHSERMKKQNEEHPEIQTKRLDTWGKNKPFDVFKIDGTVIKTFTYIFEAKEYLQKEYGITSTMKIGEVLAGNRNSSAGFVFKYK